MATSVQKTIRQQLIKPIYRSLKQIRYEIATHRTKFRAYANFPDLSTIKNPYFIVGIPGCLHVVDLCLKYVPSDIEIVLVSNGLDRFECEWARANLRVSVIIHVDKLLAHGDILDLIFDKFQQPFGILDYDCFVFDSSYFSRLKKIGNNSLFSTLFLHKNQTLGLKYPQTFLMYFNTPLINMVKTEFRVTSKTYYTHNISPGIWKQLKTIGIDQQHFPEEYKDYFDTLRLLLSLGYSKGFTSDFIEEIAGNQQPNDRIFHVGGVSCMGIPKTKWGTRGVYLWRRILEASTDNALRERYWRKYGAMTASEFRKKNWIFSEKIGNEYFDFVEKIIQVDGHKP